MHGNAFLIEKRSAIWRHSVTLNVCVWNQQSLSHLHSSNNEVPAGSCVAPTLCCLGHLIVSGNLESAIRGLHKHNAENTLSPTPWGSQPVSQTDTLHLKQIRETILIIAANKYPALTASRRKWVLGSQLQRRQSLGGWLAPRQEHHGGREWPREKSINNSPPWRSKVIKRRNRKRRERVAEERLVQLHLKILTDLSPGNGLQWGLFFHILQKITQIMLQFLKVKKQQKSQMAFDGC